MASKRGWRYGRPKTLPLQHSVILAATKLELSSLKVSGCLLVRMDAGGRIKGMVFTSTSERMILVIVMPVSLPTFCGSQEEKEAAHKGPSLGLTAAGMMPLLDKVRIGTPRRLHNELMW